ncbi:MAG: hypothetical protein AVDCRST_MAG30-4494 [uncultured Solirubrobacteraceae bacterium]|uniref:Flagellar protein FlaG n=1 Tax=uncultured Solirubrobacteraceae bacterium TaxID=1162706 RepID=A0A6J4U4Z6_9ACTN|nr:MAG: hypothetical protein AVDCRST_MAG30-4494 [uncultured Solirubrobacteraceae bacterium]
MTFGIGQLGASHPVYQPTRGPDRPSAPVGAADPVVKAPARDRVELSSSTPPPEAMAEVDRAYERVAELAAQNRELHFSKDPSSGRIIVQVRDMEGHVVRTIPNEKALHVLNGAELP